MVHPRSEMSPGIGSESRLRGRVLRVKWKVPERIGGTPPKASLSSLDSEGGALRVNWELHAEIGGEAGDLW